VSSVQGPSAVGVIGLGLMGKPMARNLIKAGFDVTVFNRSRPAIEALVADGARGATSAGDVARASDVVITMLPDGPDVELVVLGDHGVMSGAKPGLLVIDMSTISPAATRRISEQIAARGGCMLDAPVSGGDVGAQAGTLSIMVGGAREDFERAQPMFQALGNQIVVALVIEAVSEAVIFAGRAGIGPDVFVPVLQGGMAHTRVMELRGATMARHEYKPGFKAAHHMKDLRIVLETARELGVTLPATAQVERMLTMLVERGQGEVDNSAIMTIVEEMSA
jgi:2-hydroxy-3-oxopropionate reductase